MKKISLLLFAALYCMAIKAQINDLTSLFHFGKDAFQPSMIAYCQDDTKETVWVNHIAEMFKFDRNGNLEAHNDTPYTDIVRDENGIIEEATLDGFKFTFIVSPTKLIVAKYKKSNDEFWQKDEYTFNKKGLLDKRVTTYFDGDQNTKTYSYKEYTEGYWYIRKVTEKNKYGTTKYYECLKQW